MSGQNRRYYLTATVLDQTLLDYQHDCLENRIEAVVDIGAPDGSIIRASDRNKYVVTGGTGIFYEALTQFPIIVRTVGEWLSPEIQFSTLQLTLSNVDGRYNHLLPAGADFKPFVDSVLEVRVGLAELGTSYSTIFRGRVTDVAGAKRSTHGITLIARDDKDRLNAKFPTTAITRIGYPKVEDDVLGKLVPVIYGDYTIVLDPDPAIVTTYVVNGRDPFVHFQETGVVFDAGTDAGTSLNHCLDNDDAVVFATTGTLPAPLVPATVYYVRDVTIDTFKVSATLGGSAIDITTAGAGAQTFAPDPAAAHGNVAVLTAENDLASFDTTRVYLKRSDTYFQVPAADVVNVAAGNKSFEVKQNTLNLWVDSAAYLYARGDVFVVQVKGKDLGAYSDNPVWQARDLLLTYGLGVVSGDFHANWATYRDKATPAQSAIATIKSRIRATEDSKNLMALCLSLLEQVRLEAFFDRDGLFKINSLHFEDWTAPASIDHEILNWDVVEGTFEPALDERNNFNRAQATFDFRPVNAEQAQATAVYRNAASIAQTGKAISKKIEFPNLYVRADVEYQLIEMLRLASSFLEVLKVQLTWRALLRDIGEFSLVSVQIGSVVMDGVPAMLRDIGYDPQGFKLPATLWLFAMCPYPGYTPGYAGTVGGSAATIMPE